jgi:hypothetical protein
MHSNRANRASVHVTEKLQCALALGKHSYMAPASDQCRLSLGSVVILLSTFFLVCALTVYSSKKNLANPRSYSAETVADVLASFEPLCPGSQGIAEEGNCNSDPKCTPTILSFLGSMFSLSTFSLLF